MRFGIDMNTDHTLEEVGKQFDVTRERIRQIEAKALRKLRHLAAQKLCAASSTNNKALDKKVTLGHLFIITGSKWIKTKRNCPSCYLDTLQRFPYNR